MDSEEREKVFLQEQVMKVRNESKKIKDKLATTCDEYNSLYTEAQEFLKTCNDEEKVKELLKIMDETDEDRAKLLKLETQKEKKTQKALERIPTQVQQQAHLGPGIV